MNLKEKIERIESVKKTKIKVFNQKDKLNIRLFEYLKIVIPFFFVILSIVGGFIFIIQLIFNNLFYELIMSIPFFDIVIEPEIYVPKENSFKESMFYISLSTTLLILFFIFSFFLYSDIQDKNKAIVYFEKIKSEYNLDKDLENKSIHIYVNKYYNLICDEFLLDENNIKNALFNIKNGESTFLNNKEIIFYLSDLWKEKMKNKDDLDMEVNKYLNMLGDDKKIQIVEND
jgi:hypothetical protein